MNPWPTWKPRTTKATGSKMNKRVIPALLMALLFAWSLSAAAERPETGEAQATPRLIQCDYTISGGMEDAAFSMTLKRGQETDVLTVRRGRGFWAALLGTRRYEASPGALSDLEALLAPSHPEAWSALPWSDLIALDAPLRTIWAYYDDGSCYSISDNRELPEESPWLFQQVYAFLDGLAAGDAKR